MQQNQLRQQQADAIAAYRDSILHWRFASTLNTDPAPDGDGEEAQAWAQREKQRVAAMEAARDALLHTSFQPPDDNWYVPTAIGGDSVALKRFLVEVKAALLKLTMQAQPAGIGAMRITITQAADLTSRNKGGISKVVTKDPAAFQATFKPNGTINTIDREAVLQWAQSKGKKKRLRQNAEREATPEPSQAVEAHFKKIGYDRRQWFPDETPKR